MFRRAVAPLLLLLISGATASPLLHGIVPDLPGPGPGDEGFAIRSEVDWDLTGWQVTDEEGIWVAPNGTELDAGVPLWVTGDLDRWHAFDGPLALAWTDADLRLSNDGETLRLLDPSGREVDAHTWIGSSPGRLLLRGDGDWTTPRDHRIGESSLDRPTWMVDAVTAYASPDATYDVLRGLIDGANERLVVHVYAFGHAELAERLADAAARGVDVDVLVDGNVVGASQRHRDETVWLLRDIMDAGGDAVMAEGGIHRHHHLKVLVADDAVAIQSENWVESGVPVDPTAGNRGWGIVLHDADAADWFADWMAMDRDRWEVEPVPPRPTEAPLITPPDQGRYRPVAAERFNGPFPVTPIIAPDHTAYHGGPLHTALQDATARAWTQQLKMDLIERGGRDWERSDRFIAALTEAEDRGVDVRVHLAAPFSATDLEPRQVRDHLRLAGAEARLWDHPELGTLHNKGWIIDDAVVIGSMNGHHASRANNREVAVLVDAPEVTGYYAALFDADDARHDWRLPAAPVPMLLALMALAVLLRRP